MKSTLHIILIVLTTLVSLTAFSQEKAIMSFENDSIMIGEQTILKISVHYRVDTENSSVKWPLLSDSLTSNIEIIRLESTDTTLVDPDNNALLFQQIRRYVVTSFDSGYIAVPPISFMVNGKKLDSNPLLLSVYAPTINITGDIKDVKDVIPVEYNLKHWLKDNWVLLLMLALIIIAVIFLVKFILKKRKENPVEVVKPKEIIPAHIVALKQLATLRSEELWQQGEVKKYYIRISDILREYLEERHRIMALEETTDEILLELSRLNVKPEEIQRLKKILQTSDQVKFAKAHPVAADNENIITLAELFIDNTKPTAIVDE